MEEYTPNSDKYRTSLETQRPKEKPEIKPVAKGTIRNKTFLEKLLSSFMYGSFDDMKRYIIDDVIIPSITDGLYNIAISTVETIFGRSGGSSRIKKPSTRSKVSYGEYYEREVNRPKRGVESYGSGFDFSNVTFDTRPQAEKVLKQMDELIYNGYYVSVKDFCTLSKVEWNYPYDNYGWTDLSSAEVVRTLSGYYIITLPKPKVLPKRVY